MGTACGRSNIIFRSFRWRSSTLASRQLCEISWRVCRPCCRRWYVGPSSTSSLRDEGADHKWMVGCMQLQSSRVRLVEASPHDLVSPSDEARCVPRVSRFQRMYGPHVFRQTAGVCSRIMRNRARRTCTRDQLHSDLRNILHSGMCSRSSVCRHFLTCQQPANISSRAARCQLSVQLELSEHA